MAGYSDSREQNYEIKYLRKTLGRVDSRIRIPESIGAESLRHLLDGVEPASPRNIGKRSRPGWMSLQSGIAYAAAFVLIVALFYSTRLYRPDIIDGVLPFEEPQSPAAAETAADAPAPGVPGPEQTEPAAAFDIPGDGEQDAETQAADTRSSETGSTAESPADDPSHAVGGSGKATLLLEQGRTAYYWRLNDAADPDKAGAPCTLEIVDTETGRLMAQMDFADLQNIEHGFALEDRFALVGSTGEDTAYIIYDTSDPENPIERYRHNQCGELLDAKLYKDVLRVVTLSDRPDGETVDLPDSTASEYCVIGAVSLHEYRSTTKSFAGADGAVQLHNLNAYIHYTGSSGDGGEKSYIAQINFDGLDVELGTVS